MKNKKESCEGFVKALKPIGDMPELWVKIKDLDKMVESETTTLLSHLVKHRKDLQNEITDIMVDVLQNIPEEEQDEYREKLLDMGSLTFVKAFRQGVATSKFMQENVF